MSSLDERLAGLTPAQRAALERVLLRRRGARPAATIPARDPDVPLSLSFAQQRLWFLEILEPNTPLYSISRVTRLLGCLDTVALKGALAKIVERHEVLRTVFHERNGEAVQVILPPEAWSFETRDLSRLPEQEREATLQQLLVTERLRPFDLTQGPLLRVQLVRVAPEEHVLLLSVHHTAFDGWSVGVLWRELVEAYQALTSGREPDLPALPIQYGDFAQWQRRWLTGETLEQQVAYWRDKLSSPLPVLQMPTDHPRPAALDHHGACHVQMLPRELWDEVVSVAAQSDATGFMLSLSVFCLLLSRYSGQEDLIIGCPIAGRNWPEVEPLVGFFVNMLPLRVDLSGDPTFRELLGRVRETALAAYSHQDLPFEKLVEELQPERDLSRTPIFQASFQSLDSPLPEQLAPGLRVEDIEAPVPIANFDLYCELTPVPGALRCHMRYRTSLFEAETARRLTEHYHGLLRAAVANPDYRLSQLPMVEAPEAQQLMELSRGLRTPYPRETSVHELFQRQAERTPGAPAVEYSGQKPLSYGELEALATALAHRLRSLGVGSGALVAVWLEPSVEMVVAWLGILKAGAAYVPLDPASPAQRLSLLLDDTGARVVITNAHLAAQLPQRDLTQVLLDLDDLSTDEVPGEPLPAGSPDDLAYVMYTSGSTGQPKGVAIPHRGITRLACSTDYISLEPGMRVAQASNCAFDAGTFEVWGALLNGACLVGLDRVTALDPQRLAQALTDRRIGTLFLTTALLHEIAAQDPAVFSCLDNLIFGGEAADPRAARAILAAGPPRRMVNCYGPTENTTFSTWHLVTQVGPQDHSLPIGRPLANSEVYVLDGHGNLVPIGVPGEAYLGGDGLAQGYWNRPELTAEKFVPNPFDSTPGARLYRTGDLVKWLPDGTLDFLGRLDTQVKLRGFRIEPAEIEAALVELEHVRQAVVVLREQRAGDRRLVAYLTTEPGVDLTQEEVRSDLQHRLPAYMIPSAVVFLKDLPLTANGKVDRQALPVPAMVPQSAAAGPRDVLEEGLAEIWGRLLGLPSVEVQADFFDLGGHSLLAVRLLAEVEKAFGRHLPLSTLFESPTLEGLAQALREDPEKHQWSPLVTMRPEGCRSPLFLVHGIGGDCLTLYQIVRRLSPDRPVYGFEAQGIDGRGEPLGSIEEIAASYVAELEARCPEGPVALLGYSSGGLIAFEMARQLRAHGRHRVHLGLLDRPVSEFERLPADPRLGSAFAVNRLLTLARTAKWLLLRTSHETRARWCADVLGRARHRLARLCHLSGQAQYRGEPFFAYWNPPPPPERHAMMLRHFEATRAYLPGPYAGDITVFRTAKTTWLAGFRRDLGWRPFVSGDVNSVLLPGNHATMFEPPHLEALVAAVEEWLEQMPQ
jgi:amino acid adenylation domain-containing protein